MALTLKYSPDGLEFSILGQSGVIFPQEAVPENGIALVNTTIGPRVVIFPHNELPGTSKEKSNTVFELLPVTTSVSGRCASADAIALEYGGADDEEILDDELDDDEEDDIEDDEETDD